MKPVNQNLFDEFSDYAILLEPDYNSDSDISVLCFNQAVAFSSGVIPYFTNSMYNFYVFNLTLHYIATFPDLNNKIFLKYNPDSANDLILKNQGIIISSASDVDTSVSNMAYKGVQDLTFSNAMLASTIYGQRVIALNSNLKNAVVVC